MSEIWKPFDMLRTYEVSNHGRIRNVSTGTIYSLKRNGNEYLRKRLNKTTYLVHRLVYETFVGLIPKGFHVHHIDGNKKNNQVDNLMAVSPKEHSIISTRENPSRIEGMLNYNKYVKPNKIAQFGLDGVLLAVYANASEASKNSGVCCRNILQVANKTPFNKKGSCRRQAGGYIWKIAI